jgi:hypothetical protein
MLNEKLKKRLNSRKNMDRKKQAAKERLGTMEKMGLPGNGRREKRGKIASQECFVTDANPSTGLPRFPAPSCRPRIGHGMRCSTLGWSKDTRGGSIVNQKA